MCDCCKWREIETAPRDCVALFWVVPKEPAESYCDTSGKPIVAKFEPYLHRGRFGTWSALSKATHWMPAREIPAPPSGAPRSEA